MINKIDLTQLRHLMGGDEAMVSRFLELFKMEMPKQLAVLEEQLNSEDFAGANVTAHGIKGQLQTLGLDDLAKIALEIENKTEHSKSIIELAPIFQKLKTNIAYLLT